MFTDIVGYSAISQENEPLALRLLEEHRTLLRPLFLKYNGKEVKTMGDAFLVEFSSALEAARCSCEIQKTIHSRNEHAPLEQRVNIRIGMHLGDVIHDKSDVYGDAVNIASRVQSLAESGGVCLSEQIFGLVKNKLEFPLANIGTQTLKNIKDPLTIYKVVFPWNTSSDNIQIRTNSSLDNRRVAVLPFANISPDPNDEYFADGMTEEMISTISKISGLKVIARTSVMKYRDTQKSIDEIGHDLKVGTILEGSVRKSGEKLRISVQLIDSKNSEHLWAETYDRKLEDIFSIQTEISERVAESLRVQILQFERAVIGKKSTSDVEAYALYLKGRYHWNLRTKEGLNEAIKYFSSALERDPSFALAYCGLADSFALLALFEFISPHDAFPSARANAEKALKLNSALAEAHTSLGLVSFQHDWNWEEAERNFRRAIELNQNYPPAHQFFGDYLKAMGRFDEALSEMRKAQDLDPLSVSISTGVGHVLYLSRQYDLSIEQYRKALELDPKFVQAHLWFGRPFLQKGMYEEAISELKQAVALSFESTISLAVLGHAYASSGKRNEALEIIDKLKDRSRKQYLPSYWIALIYIGLGEKNDAFVWLERAYQERSSWLVWIAVEPRFDSLRSDPRFSSLLSKMRLPNLSNAK
jgi:adenylate cyclase